MPDQTPVSEGSLGHLAQALNEELNHCHVRNDENQRDCKDCNDGNQYPLIPIHGRMLASSCSIGKAGGSVEVSPRSPVRSLFTGQVDDRGATTIREWT